MIFLNITAQDQNVRSLLTLDFDKKRTINFEDRKSLHFPILVYIAEFFIDNDLKDQVKRIHLNEIYQKLDEFELYDKFLNFIRKRITLDVGSTTLCSKIIKGKTYQNEIYPRISFITKLEDKFMEEKKIEHENANNKLLQEKLNELNKKQEEVKKQNISKIPSIKPNIQKYELGKLLLSKKPNYEPPQRKSVVKNINQKRMQDKKPLKNPKQEVRISVDLREESTSPSTQKRENQVLIPAQKESTHTSENVILTESEELRQPLLTQEGTIEDSTDYKSLLRFLFRPQNDIVDYIIEDAICNDPNFKENDLELFLKYFEFLIYGLVGLRCRYHIDELGYLNIGIYAETEKDYIILAEKLNYPLNMKILAGSRDYDLSKIHNPNQRKGYLFEEIGDIQNKHKKELEKIECLKKLQLEEYTTDEISLFTPYTSCLKGKVENYRRYTDKDQLHECADCVKIKYEDSKDVSCKSSIFRNIDKERIIHIYLDKILKMDQITSNHSIFKYVFINHNYAAYSDEFRFRDVWKSYKSLKFSSSKDVLKMNKNFRNFYGEEVGFYFSWISHFITWLIVPTIIGLFLCFMKILEYLKGEKIIAHFYTDLLFTCIIIIWGNLYVQSWQGYQKLYNYVWGMEEYNIEETKSDEYESSSNSIMFMDILIPQRQGLMSLIKKVAIILILSIMIIFAILSNLLVFFVQDYFLYSIQEDTQTVKSYVFYLGPIFIYIFREVLSHYFSILNHYLTSWEPHTNRSEFRKGYAIKSIIFEFFNYYFNLYYIAFLKNKTSYCAYNDCFFQLGNQLFIIQLTGIIHDLGSLIKSIYFEHRNKRKIENEIAEIERQHELEANKRRSNINLMLSENCTINERISRIQYFTRTPYGDNNIDKEYLEVVMNFGYVIQFGATSPVSFLFALVHAFISRLADAVKFGNLQYVHIICIFFLIF
jgi:hypothetical protein